MTRLPARTLTRIALFGAALAAGAAAVRVAWTAAPPPAGPPRGIVLLCLDALRFDALSRPDALPGPMPRLQAFARDATMFLDASAASTETEPSVGSLLSGVVPSKHGIGATVAADDGDGASESPVLLLAERLSAAGWHAAACTGGRGVSPEGGLGRGFSRFSTTFDEVGADYDLAGWDQTRPKDRPFFLFLHTYAAHAPYGLRGWMRRGGGSPRAAATVAPQDLSTALERAGGRLPADLRTAFGLQFLTNPQGGLACREALGSARYDEAWAECRPWVEGGYATEPDRRTIEDRTQDAYRAGLASVDELVGDVLRGLRELGVLARADVVIVGDHGEAFGEHGTLTHGTTLYDETLRVPLLVLAPSRMPTRHVVRGSCSLLDVAPTILDLAGLPVPPGLDGRSLVPLAREEARGRPVVAELDRPAAADARAAGPTRLVSARGDRAKWILTYEAATGTVLHEEAYDLASDPRESKPLDLSDGLPSRFGDDFCRAVTGRRNAVRRIAGLAPILSPCVTLR